MLPSLPSSFRPSTSRYVVRRHLTAFSVVPLDVVVFRARALQEVFPDLAFSLVCGISVQGKRSNALPTATRRYVHSGCSDSGDRFFADRFPAEFTMTRQALLLTRSTVLPFFYGCYLQHTTKVDPHCASN